MKRLTWSEFALPIIIALYSNSLMPLLSLEILESRTLLAATPPATWTTQGPGGGGSYFTAGVNGNDLWVSSDMSGIYHSANFGASWQQINFHNSVGGINGGTGSQISFTSDPNVLYMPSTNLAQVVKSTDGGATWSKLANWSGGTAYWTAADPTTTTKLIVASGSNLYVSTNGGSSFSTAYSSSSLFVAGAFFDGSNVYFGTNKGLLVSTNGGTSFTLSSVTGIASGQFMISFIGAKDTASGTTRLLAVTSATNPVAGNSPSAYAFGKLYRLDVGGTWTDKTSAVPSGNKMHFVQMARSNITTAYLAGGDANGNEQVLKTTNGGDAWSDVFLSNSTDGGGVNNKNVATGYEGQGGDLGWGWGGDPYSFMVSASDPNRAITVDSGFIHVTSDGGASWQAAYVVPADRNAPAASTPQHKAYHTSGSDDTSVHYLTWTSASTIVAGYTDIIGWRSTDGGASWAMPSWYTTGGNGDNNTIYKIESSLDGTKLYAASSSVHDMYASNYLLDSRTNPSYQNGRVTVSSDQGATWSLVHEFGHPLVWEQVDPNNANRMYAMVVDGPESPDAGASGGIWMTNNLNLGASSTWTHLPSPPRTEGHPYILRVLNDGTLVATFSGRRSAASGTEKFTDSSGVFISTDGGSTWTDRSAANMHWYTKEITIDPTDATQNTWYVAVNNGWSGTGNDLGDLYRTTNRGLSWTKMNLYTLFSGAISIDINSVTINPTTREMYVATGQRGVLYTPDVTVAGLSASNFSDVTSFPHAWIERVFINPYNAQDVWVATFGGGIKHGSIATDTIPPTVQSINRVNSTYNGSQSVQFTLVFSESVTGVDGGDFSFAQAGGLSGAFFTSITGSGTTYTLTVNTGSGDGILGVNLSDNDSITDAAGNKLGGTGTGNGNFAGQTYSIAKVDPSFTGGGSFYLRQSAGTFELFNSATPTGSPMYSTAFSNMHSVTLTTGSADDTIYLDSSFGGTPIPATSGVIANVGGGSNLLSLVGTPASGSVTLSGGSVVLSANPNAAANLSVIVNTSATLTLNNSQQLASLNLAGGNATLAAGGGKFLKLGNLQLSSPARLNVNDNAMSLHITGGYDGLLPWLQGGSNGGTWSGSGVVTTMSPAVAPNSLTTIGAANASDLLGITGTQTAFWDGQTVDASAVLVKYTYGGDANLDGVINGDDYFQIDSAFPQQLHGWLNGDFNYDGVINGDDYFLIDSNFPAQAAPL